MVNQQQRRIGGYRALAVGAAAVLATASFAVRAHNPHDPVLALGVSPNFQDDQTLFMAGVPELNWGYKQVLRSTDGGLTWQKLSNGLDNRFDVSSLAVSPAYDDDHTLFVATRGAGIYASTDDGDSWQLFNTGLAGLTVNDIRVGGSSTTGYTLFAATTSGGLQRRAAGSTSWSRVLGASVSVAATAVSPDFAQDQTVFTADNAGRLRRSRNAGSTWTDLGIPAAAAVYDIAIAPGQAQEIFLATAKAGVYYSDDGGKTFVKKGSGLPATTAINNVAVSPNYLADRTVFCTSLDKSVYRSTNNGDSWTLYESTAKVTGQTALAKEFSEIHVSRAYAADRTVFLAAFDGLFRSSNAGVSWTEIKTRQDLGTGLALSPAFAVDRQIIASMYSGVGLVASNDAGSTWTSARSGWSSSSTTKLSLFDVTFVPNHAGAPLAMAIKNYTSIGSSSNFGASWTTWAIPRMTSVAPGDIYPTVIGISPAFDADRQLFLGTRKHGVIQSFDGGHTWRADADVPKSALITSLAVSPDYAEDGTAFAASLNGEVWRTTDGGDSWSRVGALSIVLRSGSQYNKFMWLAISPAFASDQLVLVGTNNGVQRSADGGDTWLGVSSVDIGPSTVIQQVEFSPGFETDRTTFVTVLGKGLFRVTLDGAGEPSAMTDVGASLLTSGAAFTEFALSPGYATDTTLFGISRDHVYISTNGGDTWSFAGALSAY